MIRTFKDRRTEKLAEGERVSGFPPDVAKRARNKLRYLNAADHLGALAAVPGNRLEQLHRDREGQHSIRINGQWRICFRWSEGGADDVEVADYHH